ncbi:uncharacterized protein TRIREDRAFT_75262 [Trichoderma reesei QM6a]|uniref:Predicted protein n=2 Tax=Hypocrea jecorina TaxID=51453 RepID=G0RBV4_HYPJQ|nr:uncharacterized protein TRIREDRAFT_75262 [Trichoderma reesei QM6a]EGR51124.1 predicted protein [Trichoderma reesei QM6a]ETS04687.1 hypothetical protein M419DRAFT_96543 [Trichoderma reesei RUT C-30]
MAAAEDQAQEVPWFLKTSYPVLFPSHEDLFKSPAAFDKHLSDELRGDYGVLSLESLEVGDSMDGITLTGEAEAPSTSDAKKDDEEFANRMLTENADVAFRSTENALVDLFYEMEEVVSGERLKELLDAAWAVHPLITLKTIFNARSIHLGKSSKHVFYRAAGWLAKNHPLTLIGNLRWLSRPVIEKKKKVVRSKEDEADEGFVKIEKREGDEDAVDRFDVRYGVSHGYWKDLLNILVLGMEKKLDVLEDPRSVLNTEEQKREEEAARVEKAKLERHRERDSRHEAAMERFNSDPVYRALHVTVARLFAEQLQSDLAALGHADPRARKNISLCAKWAPSHGNFHDRHTSIISSIAEIMYPRESLGSVVVVSSAPDVSREVYLRYAREQYRKDVSALRKYLEVVERDISAQTFDKIKYDRVPSIAMRNYTKLFVQKDLDRFEEYLGKVAEGKANISGAVLMPSTMVRSASEHIPSASILASLRPQQIIDAKIMELEAKVVDSQWKTLVQRIKDSGTLSSCIAVCDVSASMTGPVFKDGTTPMHSAVGLSLLVAEVTEPPFGGHFITFSSRPQLQAIDARLSLGDKIRNMMGADWAMNTNFVAVFEDLILPTAVEKGLKREEMLKRVFVFSDMQFDAAERGYYGHHGDKDKITWASSYERIKAKYEEHGYEMPELVFWNLAGGRAGYGGGGGGGQGDEVAPKPVLAGEKGTALVSGYSQGMLKVFMDNGMFDEAEEEEDGDGGEVVEGDMVEVAAPGEAKKGKTDPLAVLKKAVSHKAYDMLRVLD